MSYAARAVVALVRAYQRAVSPVLGQRCRFHPSCSEYFAQAVQAFGLVRGAYLGGRRVLRCHPFHPGGVDHVPARFTLRTRDPRHERGLQARLPHDTRTST